jgi:GNAT superfamily N-acetyltransferase
MQEQAARLVCPSPEAREHKPDRSPDCEECEDGEAAAEHEAADEGPRGIRERDRRPPRSPDDHGTIVPVKRRLETGYELDDDPARLDLDAVHAYLSRDAYWAEGRSRAEVERLVGEAQRVVGLYKDGEQVGFCRCASDGVSFAYLADVYVLPDHRGRGLGVELVREMIEGSRYTNLKWLLHTRDAHGVYTKVGFGEPGERLMERRPTKE